MASVLPFKAVRPQANYAAQVAALPYDVMTREEGIKAVDGKPLSFMHVEKSEIDVPDGTPPDAPMIYETARRNFSKLMNEGFCFRIHHPVTTFIASRWGNRCRRALWG